MGALFLQQQLAGAGPLGAIGEKWKHGSLGIVLLQFVTKKISKSTQLFFLKKLWHVHFGPSFLSLLLINSLGCQGCLRPTAHRRKWCMPFWNCWLMGALNNWVFFNFIVFFKNAEGKKNPSFWHRTGIPITYQRSRLCRVFAVPRPSKAMHDTILDSSTHKE